MDSNRLRYFLAVNETGSIRKAAEILRISPAALSKAIKLFESELNLTLITPSGRGVIVTREGKELARLGKPLLDTLRALPKEIRGKKDSQTTHPIRIGSFEIFTTHFLRGLVPTLGTLSSISLHEVIPGEMEKALLMDEVDYGITYIPIPTAGIVHQRVTQIEMGIFGLKDKFASHEFRNLPFVIPIHPILRSPNKVQGLDGWPDDKIYRLVKYRVTLMESALELCRMGLAVTYIPSFVARLHNETVKSSFALTPLKPPKGFTTQRAPVFLARRKNDPETDIFRKIAKVLRGVCQESF